MPTRSHRLSMPRWLMGMLLATTLVLSLPRLTQAAPPALPEPLCAPISTTEVERLFERWNGALASGDAATVAALYSPDALLLPTLSPEPRESPAAITDYFDHFLASHPHGRIDSRAIHLGCNQVLDAGTYSFQLTPEQGEPQRIQARYSFVYTYRDGDWSILHHHSSLLPT